MKRQFTTRGQALTSNLSAWSDSPVYERQSMGFTGWAGIRDIGIGEYDPSHLVISA